MPIESEVSTDAPIVVEDPPTRYFGMYRDAQPSSSQASLPFTLYHATFSYFIIPVGKCDDSSTWREFTERFIKLAGNTALIVQPVMATENRGMWCGTVPMIHGKHMRG